MSGVPKVPAPRAADLAQQKSDFTSEGAPPPGTVGTSVPDGAQTEGSETAKQRLPDGSLEADTGAATSDQGSVQTRPQRPRRKAR